MFDTDRVFVRPPSASKFAAEHRTRRWYVLLFNSLKSELLVSVNLLLFVLLHLMIETARVCDSIFSSLSIRSRLTRLSESRRSSRRRWGRTGLSRTGSVWEPTILSGVKPTPFESPFFQVCDLILSLTFWRSTVDCFSDTTQSAGTGVAPS